MLNLMNLQNYFILFYFQQHTLCFNFFNFFWHTPKNPIPNFKLFSYMTVLNPIFHFFHPPILLYYKDLLK